MDNKDIAITALSVTAFVLAVKLANRNKELKDLSHHYARLRAWGGVTQKILTDIAKKHPEVIKAVSKETAIDVEFYDIISKENLI